jgi:hypothetical protein
VALLSVFCLSRAVPGEFDWVGRGGGAGHEIWKRKLVRIGVWEITRIRSPWRFGCCNTMARSETAGDFERLTVDCCHDSLPDADN